ncbi:MAG: DUF3617 domain-containing protein [Acidobacteriota bacterium]|nr:DUF3617 domain-containing protein [Acidobacteriota bacterium]
MKRLTIPTLLGTAIVLALATSPLSGADRFRVGQWELTTTTQGETRTVKRCITAQEAETVNGDTKSSRASAERQSPSCKYTDYKVDGNLVSGAMTCGKLASRWATTYHGDTMEGDKFTRIAGGPEFVSHTKAKRLGDCP